MQFERRKDGGGTASGYSRMNMEQQILATRGSSRLLSPIQVATILAMYVVTEADAAAIREVDERDGELSAAIELRRRFPGITDNAKAREQARAIAGWQPLPSRPQRAPRRSRKADADTPAR